MNAQLRRAAKACLFSTVTGVLIGNSTGLAQTAGRITHADAEEAIASEPAPLATLGPAGRSPARSNRTPLAGEKMVGVRKANSKKTAARPSQAVAPPRRLAEEDIEQTAGYQGRPYSNSSQPTYVGSAAVPQQVPQQGPASQSAVERELEELYRKNGRQMPEMNMQEFQAAPTQENPAVAAPPAERGGSGFGYRPSGKTSKPNFFERVFGLGRSRKAPPRTAAAPQRPAAPAARPAAPPSGYGQSGAPSSRYAHGMPFRSRSAAAPQAAPTQRPQSLPMTREPASIGAPSAFAQSAAPETEARVPANVAQVPANAATRARQPFLDDTESLDLSDDNAPVAAADRAPQILPNKTSDGPADSPYTGLKVSPNESEQSMAREDDIGGALSDESAVDAKLARSAAPVNTPAAAPRTSAVPPAAGTPSTAGSAIEHPLAGAARSGTPAAAPTAASPSAAAKAASDSTPRLTADDDDELMELDDDEDDNEELTPGSPAGAPASLPEDDRPVFPQETSTGPARNPPAGTAAAVAKETGKSATSVPLKGFKGFCPVVLKDERRLVEARAQFKSEYRGRSYLFSSSAARQAFELNPQKYVPAGGGTDIVRLAGGEAGVEGSLEHAAWYRGRLYLFSSDETRKAFVEAPARFSVND